MSLSPTTPALQGKNVTIFGGSGFLGTYIVRELANAGATIRVISRNPSQAQHLKPLGTVGQISLEKGNLMRADSLQSWVNGADIVINLVGILSQNSHQRFHALHAQAAEKIAQAAAKANVEKLLHVSALGVDKNPHSLYARSKLAGETAILAAFPNATILRPSVIFGAEDDFTNRFACMASCSPLIPVVDGGRTRFQPIYVGDVAKAALHAVTRSESQGKIYELGGADVQSMREIIDYICQTIYRQRGFISLPSCFAKPLGRLLQLLPKPPLTADQVSLLKYDNICSDEYPGLKELGISPTSMAVIIPDYLEKYRVGGKFPEAVA